jgi:NAD(P)-dependent dehydrogenase (short-subunit alcohol dehydrogenase family)
MTTLQGKTLFISGASRGIGLAIALRAAKDGANVAIAAKTSEPHPKLAGTIYTAAEEVVDAGGKALPMVVDIRHEDQVWLAVQKTVETFGGIDILVNNAAIMRELPPYGLSNMPVDEWDRVIDVNLRGPLLCTQSVLPSMLERGGGRIVNVGAYSARTGVASMGAYTAAKTVVLRLTEAMAAELRAHNINVNCVLPATLDTPENRAAMPDADPAQFVALADLAEAIVFLASPAARAIHGAALPVTGLG